MNAKNRTKSSVMDRAFKSSVVYPILALDAAFVTTPSKRGEAPLPRIMPRSLRRAYDVKNDGGGAASTTTPTRYAGKLLHGLLHETFHAVGKDFDERDKVFGSFGKIALPVESMECHGGKWWRFRCRLPLEVIEDLTKMMNTQKRSSGRKSREIEDADFFIQQSSIGIVEGVTKPFLAYIESCNKLNTGSRSAHSNRERELHDVYYSIVVQASKARCSTTGIGNMRSLHFQNISNFISHERQFKAIQDLPKSCFSRCIVDLDAGYLQSTVSTPASTLKADFDPISYGFNSTQQKAILTAATMIRSGTPSARMTLIQGPPGTGKSHLISGLLALLLIDFSRNGQKDEPILVCAPSNTAVDQLLSRVTGAAWMTPQIRKGTFRVGRGATTSKAQLSSAVMIFATLNGSGGAVMEGIRPKCVIVDEAGQCTEADFLIPIVTHKATKVVVVGDPLQLPPTVLSQEAEKHGFKLSFMERIYGRLKDEDNRCGVRMQRATRTSSTTTKMLFLDVQYRMHPEICRFPSNHVYDGRLTTHSSVGDREQFPLTPYRVFDVVGTTEKCPNGFSRVNVDEATFVVNLVVGILSESVATPSSPRGPSVAVVTPYAGQVDVIVQKLESLWVTKSGKIVSTDREIRGEVQWWKEAMMEEEEKDDEGEGDSTLDDVDEATEALKALRLSREESRDERKPRELLTWRLSNLVDVRTIDSFQGDERDVIVFSCVRSSSSSSVGFVGDRNRMNVGLTRARRALYVVGNMETLRRDAGWNAFYFDGVLRNLVCRVDMTAAAAAAMKTSAAIRDWSPITEVAAEARSADGRPRRCGRGRGRKE